MARRVLIPLLALLLLLGTASVALGKPSERFDDERGIELISGNGRTTIALRGAVIGSVGSGWVWVTDLPGGAETDIFVAGDEDSYQIDAADDRLPWRRHPLPRLPGQVARQHQGRGHQRERGRYRVRRPRRQQRRYSRVAGGPERRWPEEWKTIKLGP